MTPVQTLRYTSDLPRPDSRRKLPRLPDSRRHSRIAEPRPAEPRIVDLPAAAPRTCALLITSFPAWAAVRLQPELKKGPFAVVHRDEIVALCPQAQARGIERSWSIARMLSLHPDVKVRPRHPAQESVAWEQVLKYLARLSPFVESVRPGLALLDLPNPAALEPLLRHLQARGGAAYDRSSAELAAYQATPGALYALGPRGTVRFLNQVPLSALAEVGISAETIERLGWFGWTCVGDLRRLTRQQLEAQFDEGAEIFRYAQAEDVRPITQYRQPPRFTARLAFEEPVREPEHWDGALDCLLVDLTNALGESKAYGITVSLETTQGPCHERYFMRQATASRRVLKAAAERMLLKLLTPEAELQAIRITLSGLVVHKPQQLSFFEIRQHLAHAELAETLHSLEARYPGLVRRIVLTLPDAYLPEERFEWELLSNAGFRRPPKRGRAPKKTKAAKPKARS